MGQEGRPDACGEPSSLPNLPDAENHLGPRALIQNPGPTAQSLGGREGPCESVPGHPSPVRFGKLRCRGGGRSRAVFQTWRISRDRAWDLRS